MSQKCKLGEFNGGRYLLKNTKKEVLKWSNSAMMLNVIELKQEQNIKWNTCTFKKLFLTPT